MGEAVFVRAATAADGVAIERIYTPIVLDSTISFEEAAPDAEEIVRRMDSRPRLPWLVATRREVVVGFAYASIHRARGAYRWSADCSIYLAPPEQRQGTGRLLYRRLFAELAELGYVSVFAGVALPNEASVGFHEAMGFVPVGVYTDVGFKHGKWLDVGWWQLSLNQPPDLPEEPREWLADTSPD